MTRHVQQSGGRRAPVPPSPLRAEVLRGRLVEALASRFDVKITVVVAGAGFGKTTALAQAIRANDAAPRGLDVWISCEPGDEDPARLSAAIMAALGAASRRGGNAERVLDALRELAPVDVCLVLDDLHELPAMSAGQELVRDLATNLPAHVHLVLASRTPVPIPLARRRAAGEVVEVGVDALAFSDAEITALAGELGGDRAACVDLAGWPSLVRLVLAAPAGALRQFLWEEVVASLPAVDRTGLLALAVLGTGSADEVAAVAAAPLDLDRLITAVPLLYRDPNGSFGAHDLWADAVQRVFPADEVAMAQGRALQVLHERGETIRMGSAAARWHSAEMFRLACRALVLESLGALPIDTAVRWLSHAPPDAVGSPEVQLLELALRHARGRDDRDDGDADAELDQLSNVFAEVGDQQGHAVALALASVVAHSHGDHLRLVVLAERIRVLPGIAEQPLLQFFVDGVDAALASLVGDVDRALRVIGAMHFENAPRLVHELVTRLRVVMLVLAGRADEALQASEPLLDSPHAYVRSMTSMVRWSSGDPSEYLTMPPLVLLDHDVNHRDRFIRAAHGAVVAASMGDRPLADALRRELDATAPVGLGARDSAIAAVTTAALAVLEHDEVRARVAIAEHLERYPLADALAHAHLRRTPAIAYICNETVRAHWDAAVLGPVHQQGRAAARQLLAARAGELGSDTLLPPPSTIVTSLPLTWSVELAVRASGAGCADGTTLVRTLASWLPAATRREIEWLAQHGDASGRVAATSLLDELPDPNRMPLRIDVIGELRLRLGDTAISSPELRRGRVRALLALLVLRGPMRRDRISALLWPDLPPSAAAQNLRVTLSRLRRAIQIASEPASVSAASRIEVHGEMVGLQPSPSVVTDLDQLRNSLRIAEHAQHVGDSIGEAAALDSALGVWRGDPFPDLAALDELTGEVQFLHRSLVDACLHLGEMHMVAGRVDEALRCAERGRQASPYSERAHRLTIACHLQRSDSTELAEALRAARALLEELGVEPDDTTKMLIRRAVARLGDHS